MEKPEVLIVGPMYPAALERLAGAFVTHKLWLAPDKDTLVASIAERVRGLATTSFYGATARLIDSLPKLEIISCHGVGCETIDLGAARRRGIVVTNTPDVLNDCVADLAIGMMIDVARRVTEGDRYVRAGRWLNGPMPLATRVSGKQLGILGLGRIGRAIAKRAAAFDMRIAYHGRREQPGSGYAYCPSPTALARRSDFLVVAVPGGEETEHMVGEEVLRALGPAGFLVNVARGSVVDEGALVRCLREKALGGAALDVFEAEPRVPDALLALENVVLSPHVGSATQETRAAMGDLAVENLVAHFAGMGALTPLL